MTSTDTTARQDTVDFCQQMYYIAITWPSYLPQRGRTVADCVNGFAYAVLANLDGEGGLDPVAVNPKGDQSADVAAAGTLRSVYTGTVVGTDHERRFVEMVKDLAGVAARREPDPWAAVGAFLVAFCRLLADGYEIRFIDPDEATYGPEFAALLPDLFENAVGAWCPA